MLKKTSFGFLLALIFLICAAPYQASAIEYGGIGGRPAFPRPDNPRSESIFIYQIKPLDNIEEGIKVINNSDQTKTLMIYATDDTPSTDGGFACEQLSEPKDGVGGWIKLSKDEVTLESISSEVVPFTISVPQGVEVGEYNGCIVIQEKKEKSTGVGLQLSLRTAIRVALTVPGKIVRLLEVIDFKLTNKSDSIYFIQPTIKNKGNTSIDADIRIKVVNFFTRKTTEYGGKYPILKNNPLVLNYEFPKPFWGGIFTARTVVTYNDGVGDRVLRSKVVVFFSPPKIKALIYIGSTVLVLTATTLFFIFKRKKRRK